MSEIKRAEINNLFFQAKQNCRLAHGTLYPMGDFCRMA